jgi:Protein of unknown function (DUF1173)
MEEQSYLINGKVFAAHDPGLQAALARIHGTPVRPRCLCVNGGVEMYVSKFADFVIKRMPETAGDHYPTCPSFALPSSASGLGEVLGKAIIQRGPDGVELRLNFPLTRRIGRGMTAAACQRRAAATVGPQALGLRGLLHYLWERAGFNRWYPRLQGKRSYAVLRKFLLHACEEVETKGLRLAERVFMPEVLAKDHVAGNGRRRNQALSLLLSPIAERTFRMMIAIGEVKELVASTLGYELVLKHLPDCTLFLAPKTGERTQRAFAAELLAWNAGQAKLIAGCLIFAMREHLYQVEALTLMITSEQWIPLDHPCEKDVIDKLVAEQRAFVKPLRYETKQAGKLPNFLLLDVGPRPMALDILGAFLPAPERAAKTRAIASGARKRNGCVWDTAQGAVMPSLPAPARREVAATGGASA